MPTLEQAFAVASPRITPRTAPAVSRIIHLFIIVVTIAIFSRIFVSNGIFTWSAGLTYVLYDTALLVFVTWKTWPLIKTAPNTFAMSPTSSLTKLILGRPSIGVIIAAYNEVDVLEKTIKALLLQSDLPAQIMIADDGSDDGSVELLKQTYGFSEPVLNQLAAANSHYPNLSWLRVHHQGKAGTLNHAINLLDTDIVITVDADTLLNPNAVAEMRAAFCADNQLVAATGVLSPVCNNTLRGKCLQWFQTYEYIRNFISRFAWMRADSLLLISGAFAAFRRDALLDVGGFDAACLVEDYELIHRLRRYSFEQQRNWQVKVIGSAFAYTSAPSTLIGFLRQRRRWFAGFLQTQYWNRDMTGNARFGKLGLLMLPVKTIDTVQPLYGLLAFVLLIYFVGSGALSLFGAVLSVIGIKIVIDLLFHLWSIFLYQRWTGDRAQSRILYAIFAAILEPFSFQLLRHTGAVMGWFYFLTGRQKWGKQQRSAF